MIDPTRDHQPLCFWLDGQEVRTSSGAHRPDHRARHTGRCADPRRRRREERRYDDHSMYPAHYYPRRTSWLHVIALPFVTCVTHVNTTDSLVVNIIAGEVVEPERRTATFGKLQGCIMLGQGLGFLSKFSISA